LRFEALAARFSHTLMSSFARLADIRSDVEIKEAFSAENESSRE